MEFLESLFQQIRVLRPSLAPLPSFSTDLQALLTPGQVVEGKVLAHLSPEQLLVDILGKVVTAECPFPLPVGAEITMQVEALSPRILLALRAGFAGKLSWGKIPGLPAALARWTEYAGLWEKLLDTLETLPDGKRWAPAAKNLQSILSRLAVPGEESSPSRVQRAVEGSGQFYESGIARAARDGSLGPESGAADLKAALLRYLAAAEEESGGEIASPPGGKRGQPQEVLAHRLLDLVELFQYSNACREDGNLFLTIPLALGHPGGMSPAYLRLDWPRRGREERQAASFTLLLYLRLSVLGNLRVEGLLRGRRVRIAVAAESSETASVLRREESRLRETLTEAGFLLAELTCRADPARVAEAAAAVCPLDLPSDVRLLDLRV